MRPVAGATKRHLFYRCFLFYPSGTSELVYYSRMSKQVIVIAGAPGSGKSTIAELLQKKLKSPLFEFGWIPEFRRKDLNHEIPYHEEEQMAFESLMLVTKNYTKHGFLNVIITDLADERIKNLHKTLRGIDYLLITLEIHDDHVLKERVLTQSRSSEYRDWNEAVKINNGILARPLLPKETRFDATKNSKRKITNQILDQIAK